MDHAKFKRLALVSGIDIRHTEEHAGEEFEDQLATFAELIVLKCVGIIEEQSKDAIRNKTYMGDAGTSSPI